MVVNHYNRRKMKIYLYTADIGYCQYLYQYDDKVTVNNGDKRKRPFVGVALCVDGKNYFAPLSSPKEKHKRMKENEDFIQIAEGKYGAINLNNMIPIPKRYLRKIEINDIQNHHYAEIIKEQLEWISINQEEIRKKSKKIISKNNKQRIKKVSGKKMLQL